jgi:hypothetical protein
MSAQDIQVTYNTSLLPLEKLLKTVKRSGEYYSAGSYETPMPSLNVAGVGVIPFPVPAERAREIVSAAAERAPYGRGDQTLVDERVRKVWQIAPEKVVLGGKGWTRFFHELVSKVAVDLGCDPENIVAEFYKMLVYDKGGFFAAHRDTEKAPGMFGTLVVALPSAHRGGDLVTRHAGREVTINLCNNDPGEIRYAAFYADCEHEVLPVTEGYRICLVYNLAHKPAKKAPVAPDNRSKVERATEILKAWAVSSDDPLKLVYLLDHHYTQATLSFGSLKNADAARAAVLREAAARSGCAFHLGIVHIEESGWAEYNGDYRRPRWYDEDEEREEEDEFEVGEVLDGLYYVDQWRSADDEPIAFGRIPLGDEELLPVGGLDDEEPDEDHFSEATGNEGASFERTYLRAAVVLWPEDRFDEICVTGGLDAAIARLGQLISAANTAVEPEKKEARERVRRFADMVPREWDDYQDHGERLTALLRHLAASEDAALIETVVPFFRHYNGQQNEELVGCAKILGPERSRSFFCALFEIATARRPGGCMDLWRLLAGYFSKELTLLGVLLDTLVKKLPEASEQREPWEDDLDECGEERLEKEQDQLTPESVAGFLATVRRTLGVNSCREFLDALFANTEFYSPENLLLPCLERMERERDDSAVNVHFWEQCAAFYLRRSARPPEEPKDWAQPVKIPGSGNNPLLRELEKFARDPEARVHRFRVRKELRQEVHRAIEQAKLDMTHITERRGSPQTLVCTKTRATYERAYQQYESDLAAMRRLLALPVVDASSVAGAVNNLCKAIAGGSE